MKNLRIICSILFIAAMAAMANGQSMVNRLIIPDLKVQAGKTARLPIALENIDEVGALQVDIVFPAGITIGDGVSLTDRANTTHQITARMMPDNQTCRIVVLSRSNASIRGNSRDLINMDILIPSSLEQSSSYSVEVKNFVLSDTEGNDLPTDVSIGEIVIATMPDLKIADLTADATSISPNSSVTLSWNVSNIGELPTTGGWSEQITLVSLNGTSKLLATSYFNETLASGATTYRKQTVNLPSVLTIDGSAFFDVKIVPNSDAGEPASALNNNEMITQQTVFVNKALYLNFPSVIKESRPYGYSYLQGSITRSGDRSEAETYSLSYSPVDSRISIPQTVTLDPGQSSLYFKYYIYNNSSLDADSIFTLTVKGERYDAIEKEFKIIDDELPSLKVDIKPDQVAEGDDDIEVKVTVERAPLVDLDVNISTSSSARLKVPSVVTIPAGNTEVTFLASAIPNKIPELDQSYRIRAYAPLHYSGYDDVVIIDDDIPSISLKISPALVSETDGENAAMAIITRTTNTDIAVPVRLYSDRSSDIKFSSSQVTMEAGVTEVSVPISIIDNSIVDYSRIVNVSAYVYLTANTTNAPVSSPGYANATLEILDEDGPTLTLSPLRPVWVEGGSGCLIISRNTLGDTPVTLALSSDKDDLFSYNPVVSMPVGTTSTKVYVTVNHNEKVGDDTSAVFTVSDSNQEYNKGACTIQISDTSLPDATITDFRLSKAATEIASDFSAIVVVANQGWANLPEETEVAIYNGKNLIAMAQLGKFLHPDESITVNIPIIASMNVGSAEFHGVVNPNHEVGEMSYSNNVSKSTYIYYTPGFTTTLSTDKELYRPGETVIITGKAQGNFAANTPICIYMMWNNVRQTISAETDSKGNFEAKWTPFASQAGHISIGSCHPNEFSTDEQAGIDIYGLKLESEGLKFDVEAGQIVETEIKVYNPGPALTGVAAAVVSKPDNCDIEFDNATIGNLASNAYGQVKMRIINTTPSKTVYGDDIDICVSSNEGAEVTSQYYLYCRYPNAQLQLSQNRLDISLKKGASRNVDVEITNVGRRETGEITWIADKWVTAVSPIASLQPGESATVTLTLTADANVSTGRYSPSRVSFNCANGNGATLTMSVEIYADPVETAKLIVTAVDDCTFNSPDHPCLSGAEIIVSNPYTGKVIDRKITDEDGKAVFEAMTEGYVAVYATAPKHKDYSNSKFMINVPADNNLEAMLWLEPATSGFVFPNENGDSTSVDTEFVVDLEAGTPAPAITVTLPKERPALNMIVPIIVSNQGYVPVAKTEISFIMPDGYEMEIIDKPWFGGILPQSSVEFYAVLRAIGDVDSSDACFTFGATAHAYYLCGAYTRVIESTARKAWGSCSAQVDDWFNNDENPGTGGEEPSIPVSHNFDIDEDGTTVSSNVSLQLSRTVVMTKQAFSAYLTIQNNTSENLNDVFFDFQILDFKGVSVKEDELFECIVKSLDGVEGTQALDAKWTLKAKTKSSIEFGITPTLEAALKSPKQYYIGGTMYYTDPNTGESVGVKLHSVPIFVNPMPRLDLTYFLQRDIFGDDLSTHDVVEPSIPAEFSLLIANNGSGDAANVNVYTHKPKVINNATGRNVNFEFVGSQLNGSDFTLSAYDDITTRFGTIRAGNTAYAQWWMVCNFMGHFVDYAVNTNFLSDDLDESVLGDISIHELIHSIVADSSGPVKGFLVNDMEDEEDTPDTIYFTDGTTEDLMIASSMELTSAGLVNYTLQVTPGDAGWNYGKVSDPTGGRQKLVEIKRKSDNVIIDPCNFWQTDRTLPDGKAPIYENCIHFTDRFDSASVQSYILTFEPTADMLLEIVSIDGIPAEGEIAYSPIETVMVAFNKAVNPASFTSEDISIVVQAEKKDASLIAISSSDNKTFTLDFTELNKTVGNGYYVLTVNTSNVVDIDGFKGSESKSVAWDMYKEGYLAVNVSVSPEEAGQVSGNQAVAYGQSLTLSAVANEGYEFSSWTIDGQEESKDAEWSGVVIADMDIVANFIKKTFMVDIDTNIAGGCISGAFTGNCPYGEEIVLTALPNPKYEFCYWIVDGQELKGDPELKIVVKQAVTVSAKFSYVFKGQLSWNLANEWNWISTCFGEPLSIDPLLSVTSRILGQEDESVLDPVFGYVGDIQSINPGSGYKVYATGNTVLSFEGALYDFAEKPMKLNEGWNWIAYPIDSDGDIESAILNPEEEDYIVSQYGFAEFSDGKWQGSISQLNVGYGYLYKSATEKSLQFSEDVASPVETSAKIRENVRYAVDVHKYPNTMNIVANLYVDNVSSDNYCIYAMCGNEIRGIGYLVDGNYYITVYGDDLTEIIFVIESLDGSWSAIANESLMFTSDIIGSRKSPFNITVDKTSGLNSLLDQASSLTIYNIQGILIAKDAKVDILKNLLPGIYILNGRKYIVK